jgi:hypothetical protein
MFTEHMVVGLPLQGEIRADEMIPFLPEELVGKILSTARVVSDPQEVSVIRHKAIRGAGNLVAEKGVQENFTHFQVGLRGQPSGTALLRCGGPMNPGKVPVKRFVETPKTSFEIKRGFSGRRHFGKTASARLDMLSQMGTKSSRFPLQKKTPLIETS